MSSVPAEGAAGKSGQKKLRWELADIFRLHGEDYRRSHALPPSHLKVMRAIELCRTAALGGHVEQCDACGFERHSYNSCRNRHCPKCQALAKARWLEARVAELLPVAYFHNVFTLPHEINLIARYNKKVVFNMLFKAVTETLQEFAADPKHLGGKIGFTVILHTWDQKLMDHLHLHCVIPAGVLSPDGSRWIHARKNFLFPVKALGIMFRGKFICFLKQAIADGKLIFPDKMAFSGAKEEFSRLIDELYRKNWVVYSKAPFAGPKKVLDYLGRYTHRVAISNYRILAVENGSVTFSYRDSRDDNKRKVMTLEAGEFIRRFLLHTLPASFMRIRHFGFLANRAKQRDLPRCRELLQLPTEPPELPEPCKETTQEMVLRLTGADVTKCPRCGKGCLRITAELPKLSPLSLKTSQPVLWDSS